MQLPIVLIGPMCAGKSTVAEGLSVRLGVPRCGLDQVRWDYYNEIGYDNEHAKQIAEAEGPAGIIRYWKPFEAHAVERVLADHPGEIIDFGAGHSVYDEQELLERVRMALAPVRTVILLLPSPDDEESVAIANERLAKLYEQEGETLQPGILEMNAFFVRHPSNRMLATHTVYTKDKTPEETCEEIIQTILS
ncbi:MAG TPA: hypothetical protein VFS21_26100 [Roseiflexaceae bacterium]|nr:hypothetical protein [Roseiflexaceae bacterium]